MSSKAPRKKKISTRSVRAGLDSDAQHGSVVPPIYLSTNSRSKGTGSRASTITPAPAIRPAISSARHSRISKAGREPW